MKVVVVMVPGGGDWNGGGSDGGGSDGGGSDVGGDGCVFGQEKSPSY